MSRVLNLRSVQVMTKTPKTIGLVRLLAFGLLVLALMVYGSNGHTAEAAPFELVQTITGFSHANGVAVDANDNIWVIDQTASLLLSYDSNGNQLSAVSMPDTLRGIAIDADGNSVIVEDGGGFTITTRDPAGNVIEQFVDQTQNSSYLAVDADGNYVIGQSPGGNPGRLGVYTPDGTLLGTLGAGMFGGLIGGVAIDPNNGKIYANDSINGPSADPHVMV